MSNALLEGMAAGLPCIAYDIPPNREVLDSGSAGILVTVGDHAALAEAMISMTKIPGLARRLGHQGRARAAATYDLRDIAARTESLYHRLLEERR
jgi:glycosyltransferase involved in cell wall biosynthesis